jgi:hypothetical protein
MQRKSFCSVAFGAVLFIAAAFQATGVQALITGGYGNAPVSDRDWPSGSLAIANHKNRLGWWEGPPFGGGQYTFSFRGDAAAFNEALQALAAINWPTVELHIHRGPHEDFWLVDRGEKKEGEKRRDARIDWSFTVWTPRNFHNLYNDPRSQFTSDRPEYRGEVPPPRIDVYLGGGLIEWSKVNVPKRVRVVGDAADVLKDRAPRLSVRVFDMLTSKPVASARVTVVSSADGQKDVATAIADADGKVAFEQLAAGTYNVRVEADGYAARELGWERLGNGEEKEMSAQLSRAATLKGRVVDSQGKPIAGAKVGTFVVLGLDGRGYTMPQRPEATSNAGGEFELKLPTGYVRLTARAPDWYYSWSEVLPVGDRRPALEPEQPVTLEMARTTSVTVKATDSSGKPAAGQTIFVQPSGNPVGKWGGSAETDAADTAVIQGVPPGEYRLTDRPYDSRTLKELHVEEGKAVTAQVRL